MVDEKYTIEQLLTGHFIKYNRLSELIDSSYAGSNCTKINLFIKKVLGSFILLQ